MTIFSFRHPEITPDKSCCRKWLPTTKDQLPRMQRTNRLLRSAPRPPLALASQRFLTANRPNHEPKTPVPINVTSQESGQACPY